MWAQLIKSLGVGDWLGLHGLSLFGDGTESSKALITCLVLLTTYSLS
jgi:hypothetical protein